MNGVVVADRLVPGGPDAAREALERFWSVVSDAARFSPIRLSVLDILFGS